MAARGPKNGRERTEAERARLHAARTALHEGKIRRRFRDNVIASVGGAVIVIAAVASQVVHAQVTAPEPTPTPSVVPTEPVEMPVETPLPGEELAPSDEPAPVETPAE